MAHTGSLSHNQSIPFGDSFAIYSDSSIWLIGIVMETILWQHIYIMDWFCTTPFSHMRCTASLESLLHTAAHSVCPTVRFPSFPASLAPPLLPCHDIIGSWLLSRSAPWTNREDIVACGNPFAPLAALHFSVYLFLDQLSISDPQIRSSHMPLSFSTHTFWDFCLFSSLTLVVAGIMPTLLHPGGMINAWPFCMVPEQFPAFTLHTSNQSLSSFFDPSFPSRILIFIFHAFLTINRDHYFIKALFSFAYAHGGRKWSYHSIPRIRQWRSH